jgi:hypothetical protein
MIKIKQFKIWINGKLTPVDYLYLQCNSDNIKDSASFYYALYNEIDEKVGNKIVEGNLVMTGTDYENFNSNEFAINWVVNQLGVVLIPQTIGEIPVAKKGKNA